MTDTIATCCWICVPIRESGKARQFREWFPGRVMPYVAGSSYGSLRGTVLTRDHQEQVPKQVLLALAVMLEPIASLTEPKPFDLPPGRPVSVATIVVHGFLATNVPLEPVWQMLQKRFTHVKYYVVDDHRLHKTVHELDWNSILE